MRLREVITLEPIPHRFNEQIVLAAPMLAPNTGKLPNGIVGAVAWVATNLAQGHRWDTPGRYSLCVHRRSCLKRIFIRAWQAPAYFRPC